jgi:hypothetical protein
MSRLKELAATEVAFADWNEPTITAPDEPTIIPPDAASHVSATGTEISADPLGEPEPDKRVARRLYKRVTPLPRRSQLRGKRDAARRRVSERFEACSPLPEEPSKVERPTGAPLTPSTALNVISASRKNARDQRLYAPWRDQQVSERLIFVGRAFRALPCSIRPFSLNLSQETIDAALMSRKSPMDYLKRSISRHVEKALGHRFDVLIAFGVADGRLHAHGILALHCDADLPKIETALLKAAGNPRPLPGQHDPLRIQEFEKDLRGVDGWIRYCCKNMSEARRADIPRPHFSVTSDIRAGARTLYDESRNTINAMRSIHPVRESTDDKSMLTCFSLFLPKYELNPCDRIPYRANHHSPADFAGRGDGNINVLSNDRSRRMVEPIRGHQKR